MKKLLLLTLAVALGALAGNQLGRKQGRIQGQLNACGRIFSVLNNNFNFGMECVVDGDDVVLQSSRFTGLKVSLEGQVLSQPTPQ